jgi:hypothetical protein
MRLRGATAPGSAEPSPAGMHAFTDNYRLTLLVTSEWQPPTVGALFCFGTLLTCLTSPRTGAASYSSAKLAAVSMRRTRGKQNQIEVRHG